MFLYEPGLALVENNWNNKYYFQYQFKKYNCYNMSVSFTFNKIHWNFKGFINICVYAKYLESLGKV